MHKHTQQPSLTPFMTLPGPDPSKRIYVHVDEIGEAQLAVNFTLRLHSRLVTHFDFQGDVMLTDEIDHEDGEWFTGDIPDAWTEEDSHECCKPN